MTKIEFTEEEIKKLRYESFHHPHPRVQQKMQALLLKSQGVPHWQICNILAITENTLRAYFRAYMEGGIETVERPSGADPSPSRATSSCTRFLLVHGENRDEHHHDHHARGQ